MQYKYAGKIDIMRNILLFHLAHFDPNAQSITY